MEKVEYKEYIIKPVPRAKFSGISSLPKTKTVYTGAQLGRDGYKTGLTEEEERKFEKELGLEPNTLNKKNSKFWAFLELRLNNDKETRFDVSTPLDVIKFKALTERSSVAKSELEIRKNPMVEFYVVDEEAKAKVIEKRADIKLKALEMFNDMTADERKGILKLYGRRGTKNLTDRQAKANLFEELESSPDRFISFMEDKNLQTRIMVEDLLEKGLLTKRGGYYVWENESLGSSIESVIGFFNDPKNQSIKITMGQEAKNKDKESK